jgi:hypothetical protein
MLGEIGNELHVSETLEQVEAAIKAARRLRRAEL